MVESSALSRTLVGVRLVTSVFFLLFGEYKLAGPAFVHGGFQTYLQDYIANTAVSFYRPFLTGVVQPYAVFFGYLVGVIESLVGLSLLLGLWVRPACILGGLFLVNMILCTWWEPGRGVSLWRYFGVQLDHIPLLLLLVVFYAADAGQLWGVDAWRARWRSTQSNFVAREKRHE